MGIRWDGFCWQALSFPDPKYNIGQAVSFIRGGVVFTGEITAIQYTESSNTIYYFINTGSGHKRMFTEKELYRG